MNNIRKIGVLVFFMLSGIYLSAQAGPGREKIKALKVAFITERLNLSSAEAQQFWPIYNEHEQKMQALNRRERQEIQNRFTDLGDISDGEADDLLASAIALQQQKQQLQIDYLNQVSEAIGPRKTIMLLKAEEDFKRRLLREIQQRRRANR